MKNLKKDLQVVNKDLNALSKKIEKLIAAAGKPEKPKAAKAKPAKKTASKKTAAKTAPATILEIIKRSKKGVDLETLKKKTGFNNKKISNNHAYPVNTGLSDSVGFVCARVPS